MQLTFGDEPVALPAQPFDGDHDDIPAAFGLAVRLLKERRHLAFDELADVLKSHGYPVSGELRYVADLIEESFQS